MPAPDGPFYRCPRQRLSEFDRKFKQDFPMKAFLLAAGHGTRLRPLTDSLPKCLVPIRGKPLLDIWLDLCARSGITDVLINLHAHSQPIEQHLQQRASPVNVRLIYEDQLLGSAGTLAANREWIGSDTAFWILYSDVLTNMNLRCMSEFHRAHGAMATLGLYQVPDPSRCGVAIIDDKGVIVDFEEKPHTPRSNWVFSGLMLAGSALFNLIPPDIPADIALHLLPRLLGRMRAYPISDYLLDIGTMANYEKAQTTWPGDSRNECLPDEPDEIEGRTHRLPESTDRKYEDHVLYGEGS
jgi:mannose-1-phosphate guanylyltransferase